MSEDKLAQKLDKRPLMFTAIPIRDSKTGDRVHDEKILKNLEQRKQELASTLGKFHRLDAISVPELVEENHEGKPRYNSIYTRMLSRGTADLLGIDAVINKVVAHMDSYADFSAWISETDSLGISNMIFVGGNTRHHRYPGPSVSEANIAAREMMSHLGKKIVVGNICLPERRDEAKKMLFKTISGADFFTTQMLFGYRQISDLLIQYQKLCDDVAKKPATVVLSFAPLKSTADLNLLDFLGVDLPESSREYILEDIESVEASKKSILNALKIYSSVLETVETHGLHTPIGINIEQLTKSNLSYSNGMLQEFSKVIDMKSDAITKHVATLDAELHNN